MKPRLSPQKPTSTAGIAVAIVCLLLTLLAEVEVMAQVTPLTLKTAQPCNLYGSGARPLVTIAGPAGACTWQLTDFAGREVATGTAQLGAQGAQVQLEALPIGYYELRCKSGDQNVRMSLGVVADHSKAAPPSTRLNVDSAGAWLCKPEHFVPLAQSLRLMGIGWARERFSWGQTEPKQDEVAWQQYDANAAAYNAAGVRVYQIFHDSPGWTRDGDSTRNPRDLRDVYRFTRRLAEHYRGKVQAWEIWNEPDIGFWPDLSDSYAGLVKAAYLGFKSADPELPVLLGSFCRGVCDFDRGVLKAGVRDYFDIFNWHIYAPPAAYAPTLGKYLALLQPFGVADRPVWLTEAGIRLEGTEPGGELNAADERRQAEFIPCSLASSLAAGTDRHFFFVFPYYLENGVQFGVFHQDLSPRPACVALAAAADLLGEAKYLGRYPIAADPKAVALAFDTGRGRTLVVWSEVAKEVTLPVDAAEVTLADAVGASRKVSCAGDELRLTIGPGGQYVCGVGAGLAAKLVGPVRPEGRLPQNRPCPVVVRGRFVGLTIDKGKDCVMAGMKPCKYAVEACNFGTAAARGTLRLQAPVGFTVEPREAPVALDPMGRAAAEFTLTPGKPMDGLLEVAVVPEFAGLTVAPSVSHLRFDYKDIPVAESKDLELNVADRWTAGCSGNCKLTVSQAGDAVRFDIHFTGPGDRWYYPFVRYEPPQDFSQFQGVSFEYRCNAADPASTVRLQLYEENGAGYLCGTIPSHAEWTTVAVRFNELEWGSFSPVDPNGQFDPQAIKTLMIGGNTPKDDLWLEVRNVKLVRW